MSLMFDKTKEDDKSASTAHKLRNSVFAVLVLGATLAPATSFAWTPQATTITTELTGGGTGASGGVASDMQTVGVATVSIAIVPYAFSRLKSMLR